MSNYTSLLDQTHSGSPSPPNQGVSIADKPSETSSFVQENDPTFQEDPARSEVFSSAILRSNFPDLNDRVHAIWHFLSLLVVENVPYDDYRQIGQVSIDELIELSGFKISDSSRRYFDDHFRCRRPTTERNQPKVKGYR
ncbi:MAG: hypothetical protein RBT11_01800 [Desulfobacterales bacterium]|nr:hypothetical protein [Desulfobacterales bacterium]